MKPVIDISLANEHSGGYNPGGSVYFLGIGGIGMSALARYFNSRGVKVSGYDRTATVLTKELENEGIKVHFSDDVSTADINAALIIVTPAIPQTHTEWIYFREHGYVIKKRSEVLGLISKASFNICVAGTHGKTTTSTLIAHILRDSGFGCNAFLGGISANYETNFWSNERNVCVAEADEYDRSFLQLHPDIAVITSMEPDHLDIYGDEKNMQDAFVQFSKQVKPGGMLCFKKGLPRTEGLGGDTRKSYSLDDHTADARAENIRVSEKGYHFDVVVSRMKFKDLFLPMGGRHNVENAVAAVLVSAELGIEEDKIRNALSTFKGVKRRFEFVVNEKKNVFIDDYAHHPGELKALLHGVRDLYPDKKITIAFQPHLYSRTKNHADGFAEALDLADEIMLLPIYPARELPIEGVNSEMIAAKMKHKAGVVPMDSVVKEIERRNPELLVTAGAGNIDTLVMPIKQQLLKK